MYKRGGLIVTTSFYLKSVDEGRVKVLRFKQEAPCTASGKAEKSIRRTSYCPAKLEAKSASRPPKTSHLHDLLSLVQLSAELQLRPFLKTSSPLALSEARKDKGLERERAPERSGDADERIRGRRGRAR